MRYALIVSVLLSACTSVPSAQVDVLPDMVQLVHDMANGEDMLTSPGPDLQGPAIVVVPPDMASTHPDGSDICTSPPPFSMTSPDGINCYPGYWPHQGCGAVDCYPCGLSDHCSAATCQDASSSTCTACDDGYEVVGGVCQVKQYEHYSSLL